MPGQAHLMDRAPVQSKRPYPASYQHAGTNSAASGSDVCPTTVFDSPFSRQLGRDFAKELRLQLRQVREEAAHCSGGVVLCQAVGCQNVGEALVLRPGIQVSRPLSFQSSGVICLPRVEEVLHRRFPGLVVGRQRSIIQSGGNPNPPEAIRMQDKGLVAGKRRITLSVRRWHVVWRLCLSEVRRIEPSPLFPAVIPPHEFLALAPWRAVRTGGGAIVDNATVGGPGESPTLTIGATGLILPRPIFARTRKNPGINPATAGRASVVFQRGKTWNQSLIGKGPAVDFLQNFLD